MAQQDDIEYIKSFNNMRVQCDVTFNNEVCKGASHGAMDRDIPGYQNML